MITSSRSQAYVLTVLFLLTFVSTAVAKYSGGTGEPNDPYQIATAADLIALGETPDDYDKHFILTADIDLDPNLPGGRVFDGAIIAPDTDPEQWGFQGTPFAGVFHGNGRTISRLTIAWGMYVGLFGQMRDGASIRNLGLDGVEVSGHWYVGGLVGHNDGGRITSSYSSGSVNGNECVGGLTGRNGGSIAVSYSNGSVSGYESVGGLVGICDGGSVSASCSSGSVIHIGFLSTIKILSPDRNIRASQNPAAFRFSSAAAVCFAA